MNIAKDLAIDGDLDDDGVPDITVRSNGFSRVFHISGLATVTLEGLIITGGKDPFGGGIYADGVALTVTHSTLSGNRSDFDGGGIFANGGTLTVTQSTVSGNSTGLSGVGGGIFAVGGTLTVTHSTLSGNSASSGGGIFAAGGTLTVTHSTLSGNSASSHGGGGGIYAGAGTLTVTHSTLLGNSSSNGGGGIFADGGTLAVTNSIFTANSSFAGGALGIVRSNASVTNATFSGNTASNGVIYNADSPSALTNVILWGNTAPNGSQIYNDPGPAATATYSLVQGGYPGTGNLDVDPQFVDATIGDFRPLLGSPAIDAGTNAGGLTDDIRGLLRPVNTTTDIGAYEWQGLTLSQSGGDNQSTPIITAFANPLTVTVGSAAPAAQAEPVTGAQVSFAAPAPASGPSATLNPAGPVTVTCSGTPAVCTASVTATANATAGLYAVSASATGATPVAFSLNNTAPATVTLSNVGPHTYDGTAKSATCTANPSVATQITYNGSTTPPTNAGSYAAVCTVTDPSYTGSASGTFTITQANQAIIFNPPASGAVGGSATLSASGGGSGNPVTFASQTGGICSVSGNRVNYLAVGVCTLRASQAGNASYNAAPAVDGHIRVGPAAIPTLSEWAIWLLAGLLSLFGMGRLRQT